MGAYPEPPGHEQEVSLGPPQGEGSERAVDDHPPPLGQLPEHEPRQLATRHARHQQREQAGRRRSGGDGVGAINGLFVVFRAGTNELNVLARLKAHPPGLLQLERKAPHVGSLVSDLDNSGAVGPGLQAASRQVEGDVPDNRHLAGETHPARAVRRGHERDLRVRGTAVGALDREPALAADAAPPAGRRHEDPGSHEREQHGFSRAGRQDAFAVVDGHARGLFGHEQRIRAAPRPGQRARGFEPVPARTVPARTGVRSSKRPLEDAPG